MHRIQVQLTAEQARMLKDIARLRRVSISALIREAIDASLEPNKQRRDRARKRALDFAGSFSDQPDVARRHDDYLLEREPARNKA